MKKTDAYLTVEAALVLPIVLAVIVLIIYLWLFQYDRCVMEQNMGTLALRGCTLQIKENLQLAQKLHEETEKMDDADFFAWNISAAEIRVKGNQIYITQNGFLKFPFPGLLFWQGDDRWKADENYKSQRISPVTFIRNYRRLKGGK